ncbi:MAG: nitrogenase iron-molybdenum cofactor biosynthesis protein NifE [Planctomycetaceae bacterium]|jgi:nitrogenase molybdenum-cofactor synthesis protein NifE|nr:nitrogenase iron-molybdenum cofactor biosynthesis protein NifE [Planctomycetaceae bacterium]
MLTLIPERRRQILEKGRDTYDLECAKPSVAGSVSQRSCVFCGSRVVLYPIADALHLVHGPIGCAAYTWDIRGSMSQNEQLHRMSFSTDLKENEVIHGGEKKLYNALTELIERYQPNAAFVYCTCIVGLIGDDVEAVCKRVEREQRIRVVPVHSEGFKGTKKDGYRAACEALFALAETPQADYSASAKLPKTQPTINILGEFNLAGETLIIKDYYRRMGVNIAVCFTGDCKIADLQKARNASLNVVQCSGSMTSLAKMMQEKFGTPFKRVSYFGIEDMSKALYDVAEHFKSNEILQQTQNLVKKELSKLLPKLEYYRNDLQGRKAAIYVGGPFKAFSLIKALRHLGMETVVVGSQTGTKEDYDLLKEITQEGTIICDDSNPLELSRFMLEKHADLLIGGVKERPIAYKMGIGFCDHNHERKIALAGFEGMLNFAKEVHKTVMSPVWKFSPAKRQEGQ